LFGEVRPKPLPPGRGQYAERRSGVRLIQTAYVGGTPPE
jgi:S-DNA-T family DNA segregation ATPase FtsK/SpoIIIE